MSGEHPWVGGQRLRGDPPLRPWRPAEGTADKREGPAPAAGGGRPAWQRGRVRGTRGRVVGWLAGALLSGLAARGAAPPVADSRSLVLSSDLRIVLEEGRRIEVEVRRWPGESFAALARRVCDSPARARDLEQRAETRTDPREAPVRIPLAWLSDDYRALVLINLFPADRAEGGDWVHVARSGAVPTYDEGMWQVAEWFTGNGTRFRELMALNGLSSPELAPGQTVRIPGPLLHAALRARPRSEDGSLEYGSDDEGRYAGYRLRRGEALYSAVVVRFTGRTDPDDVNDIASALARRSGIRDVQDIPIGFLVKVPLDLLEPEFLPKDDPRHRQAQAELAELARELDREPLTPARRELEGVLVILDPGHGGRDAGTTSGGVREHDHVYDVACRLKRRLELETSARVRLTLWDSKEGCDPSEADPAKPRARSALLTTPPFRPDGGGQTRMGVHLRWYLANSIYRRATTEGLHPDRVVFLSLHADARHPALSGVMVYVPAARYRDGTFGARGAGYRKFREFREQPRVSFSRRERLRSEALSRRLASHIVDAFRDRDLPVQPYQPIRERVIRGRRTWLPAVLKGNAVPAKVLVELVNLNHEADARLLRSPAARERIAAALADSLVRFYRPSPAAEPVKASRETAGRGARPGAR